MFYYARTQHLMLQLSFGSRNSLLDWNQVLKSSLTAVVKHLFQGITLDGRHVRQG